MHYPSQANAKPGFLDIFLYQRQLDVYMVDDLSLDQNPVLAAQSLDGLPPDPRKRTDWKHYGANLENRLWLLPPVQTTNELDLQV